MQTIGLANHRFRNARISSSRHEFVTTLRLGLRTLRFYAAKLATQRRHIQRGSQTKPTLQLLQLAVWQLSASSLDNDSAGSIHHVMRSSSAKIKQP